jgi:hypothetical protein
MYIHFHFLPAAAFGLQRTAPDMSSYKFGKEETVVGEFETILQCGQKRHFTIYTQFIIIYCCLSISTC